MKVVARVVIKRTAHVYVILVDGIERYIGKGTKDRLKDHLKIANYINRNLKVLPKHKRSLFYNNLAKALRENSIIERKVIVSGLTSNQAFSKEREEIKNYPIPEQLWNVHPGGNGVPAEYLEKLWKEDPERGRRHSQLMTDIWANPELRTKRFAEPGSREAQRDMMLANWADPKYREMQLTARKNSTKPHPGWKNASLTPEAVAKRGKAIAVGQAKSEKMKKYHTLQTFNKMKKYTNQYCSVLGFGV